MTWPPPDPRAVLSSEAVWQEQQAVANAHPTICRVLEMEERAQQPAEELPPLQEGGSPRTIPPRDYRIPFLEIKPAAAPAGRPVVLLVAGLHAGELLPPPALVELGKRLVDAYAGRREVEYRSMEDGGVTYARWTVSAEHVRKIVDAVTIRLVPVANPAGRDWVVRHRGGSLRGNRNIGACPRYGVNLNLNFAVAWPPDYYHPDDLRQIERRYAPRCTAQSGADFRGTAAASEPETRNLQRLIDRPDVRWFVDVHMHGRMVVRPWGMAGHQSDRPTDNFDNRSLDRTRRAISGAYKEYLPSATPHRLEQTHDTVAHAMHHAIRAQAGSGSTARERSQYEVIEAAKVYARHDDSVYAPVPGSALDYAVSRGLRPAHGGPVYGFGMEVGYGDEFGIEQPDNDGGMTPPPGKYDKVEREMHAGLFTVLRAAAGLLGKKAKKGK